MWFAWDTYQRSVLYIVSVRLQWKSILKISLPFSHTQRYTQAQWSNNFFLDQQINMMKYLDSVIRILLLSLPCSCPQLGTKVYALVNLFSSQINRHLAKPKAWNSKLEGAKYVSPKQNICTSGVESNFSTCVCVSLVID